MEKSLEQLEYEKTHRNAIANDWISYADRDYIAARTLFRNDCLDQFLYMAQQCLEKYLKGILLYHDVENKKGGHCLDKLLERCKGEIKCFEISDRVIGLITNLKSYNSIRYPDIPFYGRREWLIDLDHSVRELRFFAQSSDRECFKRLKKHGKGKLDEQYTYNMKSNALSNGYLEKIIRNKDGKCKMERSNLIWKNMYYGTRKKKSIRFRGGHWSKNNYLFAGGPESHKKRYEAIEDYVWFSSKARAYFNSI